MTREEKQKMVLPEETFTELIREAVKEVGNKKSAPSVKMPQPKKRKRKTMKEKDKDLLLKDLCMRLPYRVFIRPEGLDGYELLTFEPDPDLDVLTGVKYLQNDDPIFITDGSEYEIGDFKPYLRPMSSMTEEEKSLFLDLRNTLTYQENGEYDLDDFNELQDFLNRNHFDWRGLIPMGLAIEVTEENNPYK